MHIDYAQVEKIHGANAKAVFQDICAIVGTGNPGENFHGGLDLTGLGDAEKKKVEALMAAPKVEKKQEGTN